MLPWLHREVCNDGIRSLIEDSTNSTGPVTGTVSEKGRGLGLLTTQPARCTVGSTEQNKSAKMKHSAVNAAQATTFPTESRLELRQSSVGHRNAVSDVSLVRVSQYLLVSASMDGVIKLWR